MKTFFCSIFIDDGNELDTLIEGEIKAKNGSEAVSILLSNEAYRRSTSYFWLKEKVISSLAMEYEK